MAASSGGGVFAMLLGALMLVRSPLTGGGVSLGVALGATLPFALMTIVLMRLVLRSRRWAPQTGVEQLVHETGEVRTAIGGAGEAVRGLVFVHGELWRASSTQPIVAGAHVRVSRVDDHVMGRTDRRIVDVRRRDDMDTKGQLSLVVNGS